MSNQEFEVILIVIAFILTVGFITYYSLALDGSTPLGGGL